MQNRYAGDVGDFGKLGMLRCIEQTGVKIGVNWYLVDDEIQNQDGKHIGYLQDNNYVGNDDILRIALATLIQNGERSVKRLEQLNLLQSRKYFHEILKSERSMLHEDRISWHLNGLKSMKDSELVFLDPDNGLIPKSVSLGSKKSIKYVLPEEIIDYFVSGHSVVFYSHRTREKLDVYLKRFNLLFGSKELNNATIVGISFCRGTTRDYFFILQEEHKERILKGIDKLLCSNWSRHFTPIEIP